MKKTKPDADMDTEETVILQDYRDDHKNSHVQGGTKGNDSEEEEDDPRHAGGQRVQCAQ